MVRPFYTEENESTQESQQDESLVMSPTYSQIINTISLSDEDFEINKDLLRKDFYSEVNKQRKDSLSLKSLEPFTGKNSMLI